jgi:hypothetical protein
MRVIEIFRQLTKHRNPVPIESVAAQDEHCE